MGTGIVKEGDPAFRGNLAEFRPKTLPFLKTGKVEAPWFGPKYVRDKDRSLRIMWFSVAPYASSGYGQTTRNIVGRLIHKGWQIAVATNYGGSGTIMEWNEFLIYPGADDGLFAYLPMYIQHWEADLMIVHLDLWPRAWCATTFPRTVLFAPVDRDPMPEEFVNIYRSGWKTVSQSAWGTKVLSKHGVRSTTIEAGVDTGVFAPSAAEGDSFRELIGVPDDAFLINVVGVNNGFRKQHHKIIAAFAEFLKTHKDAWMFMHTEPEQGGGLNLRRMAEHHRVQDRIKFTPFLDYIFGLPNWMIAKMIASSDVHLNATNSGGSEIPIIEAMACGVPAIAQDWGPMGDHIRPVAPELLMKPQELELSSLLGLEATASIPEMLRCLELVYEKRKPHWSSKVRKHAVETYDYDTKIIPQWDQYLLDLQNHISGKDIREVQ